MSKDTFFLAGSIFLCTSLFFYSMAPTLIIHNLEDFVVLVPHLVMSQPVATACLVVASVLYYKSYKKDP